MSTWNETYQSKFRDLLSDLKIYLKQCSEVILEDVIEVGRLEYRFITFQKRLDKIKRCTTLTDDENLLILAMKASLHFEDSYKFLKKANYLDMKNKLDKAMALIKEYNRHPLIYFLYLKICNYLSYSLIMTKNILDAKKLLEHCAIMEVPLGALIYTTEDLFTRPNLKVDDFVADIDNTNEIVSGNLQLLGEVYKHLGMLGAACAQYHKILVLELDLNTFNSAKWARRCVLVARLYLRLAKFDYARFYLSAAESAIMRHGTSNESGFNIVKAELARTWARYGLKLFTCSTKYFSSTNKERRAEVFPDYLKFKKFNVKIADIFTHLISTQKEATILFTFTCIWLSRTRSFYTLRDFPIIFTSSIFELSETFRFMILYEENLDKKLDLTYKRIDFLKFHDSLVKVTNARSDAQGHLRILIALAETQIDLMRFHLKRLLQ